jgi:hypothetical protein
VFTFLSFNASNNYHDYSKEDDYTIDHTTGAAIHELISSGNMEELWDLFNNMDETRK